MSLVEAVSHVSQTTTVERPDVRNPVLAGRANTGFEMLPKVGFQTFATK